ncbi:MAG: hypothetical protein MJZ64_06725 [Paludibacteraceae bacterium]|nr:hypothetical protein [Paludibacteraceae bacterium]
MKTKLFSLFVVVLITTNVAFAADCYIDGILYDLYGDEATVTCDNNLIEYTGHRTIPSSITYQYKTYRVVAIAPSAFKDCPKLTGVTIGNSVTRLELMLLKTALN